MIGQSLAYCGHSGPVHCFQVFLLGEDIDQVCEDLTALCGAVIGRFSGQSLPCCTPSGSTCCWTAAGHSGH